MEPEAVLSHHSSSCPQCGAKQTSQTQAFCQDCRFPLQVLSGRYRLRKHLAAGGFGVVYLGYDLEDGRDVAVKVLRAEMFDEPQVQRHFLREIELTTHLSRGNPHIVQLYGHGEEQGLGHYYVMEYLQGQSLRDWLNQASPLSFRQVFRIFGQICHAMQAAHEQAIIHRDLKPANIFLVEHEGDPTHVKVLDFGLAKSIATSMMSSETQGTFGTLQYMAPEQVLQQRVDASADIYTLGVILYEMATRTRLFGDANIPAGALGHLHVYQNPEPLGNRRPEVDYPETLEWALFKALQKDPQQRFTSVQAFWKALRVWEDWPGVIEVPEYKDATASIDIPYPSPGPFASLPAPSLHDPLPDGTVEESADEQERKPSARFRWWTIPVQLTVLGVLLVIVFFLGYNMQKPSVLPSPSSSRLQNQKRGSSLPPRAQMRNVQTRTSYPSKRIIQKQSHPPPRSKVPLPRKKRKLVRKIRRRITYVRRRRKRRVQRTRRRVRRMVQHRRKHRVPKRRFQNIHPCGKVTPNTRWVIGVCKRPSCRNVSLSFPQCSTCRLKRNKHLYCVRVPLGRSVRVKVQADGYHPCSHAIVAKVKKLRWLLRPLTTEMLFGQNYSCMQSLR